MASINEKLNYINETKSLIKDKLNDLGSEIDNEITFREYAEKIEDLYDEWPKTNNEDTNITLNNTKKGKMSLQLKGNINQFTTIGKNLFKNINTIQTKNGITYTPNNDGTFNLNGTSTDIVEFVISCPIEDSKIIIGDSYTLSSNINCSNDTFQIYLHSTKENNLWVKTQLALTSGTSQTGTVSEATGAINYKYVVRIANGVSLNLNNIQIQLETGSLATNFEPYTGGIASPNPNYPQDIHIVSGNNEIKVKTKNLFNKHKEPLYKNNNNIYEETDTGITFTAISATNSFALYEIGDLNDFLGKTLTFSISNQPSATFSDCRFIACDNDGSNRASIGNALGKSSNTLTTLINDTFTQTKLCIRLFFSNITSGTSYTLNDIQIEENSISTSYAPYQEQSLSLNLDDLEYSKINDYKDEFYLATENDTDLITNKWYLKKNIDKIILDGSENWTKSDVFYISSINNYATSNNIPYSNYFIGYSNISGASAAYNKGNNKIGFINKLDTPRLYIRYDSITNAADFKTWLSTHNTIVDYALSTPQYILLNDTLQLQLTEIYKKVKAYQDCTNISQVNNDLPFIINATALMKNSD